MYIGSSEEVEDLFKELISHRKQCSNTVRTRNSITHLSEELKKRNQSLKDKKKEEEWKFVRQSISVSA